METLSGLVSVILPVKSWRSVTTAAVRSILDQTYDNIELLLIDQPEPDSLAENLQSAAINDSRVKVIPRTAPGIVNALNVGLKQANGDFIARMDDDDIAYPDRLETQLRYLNKHNDYRLCAGKVRFINGQGSANLVGKGTLRYEQWLNHLIDPENIALACFAENPMPHPTLIAHRYVWQQLKGYRDVDGPEDHDLILRAKLLNIPMGKPDSIVLDWREHDSRMTYTDNRYRRQAFIALAANALSQAEHQGDIDLQHGVWIAGTGKHARHWHDELLKAKTQVHGFVDITRPGDDRSKRDLPVITYEQLVYKRKKALIISAVSQPKAKTGVRQFCKTQQWTEGSDFIMGC